MKKTNNFENAIAFAHLDHDATMRQINKIIKDNNYKDVNYLEITNYNDGSACVWLINHDGKKYNYFNNSRGFNIEAVNVSNMGDHLLNLLKLNTKRLGEALKPVNGYKVINIGTNKPAVLEAFKSEGFICFVAWNGYNFKTFNIFDKKTINFELCFLDGVDYSYNQKDANETRKAAKKVFALYGDTKKIAENEKKHNERTKDNRYNLIEEGKRYTLKDFLNNKIHVCYGQYKYIENKFIFNKVSVDGYSKDLNGSETKEEIFNLFFDKSGYFTAARKEQLKRNAEKRKQEKERIEWENTNKSEFVKSLLLIRGGLIAEATNKINIDKLLTNQNALNRAENIKNIIASIDATVQKLKDNTINKEGYFYRLKEIKTNYIKVMTLLKCLENKQNSGLYYYEIKGDQLINTMDFNGESFTISADLLAYNI